MSMLGAFLTPHPPVLLPEVGNGREREIAATGQAMRTAAAEVARWNPDVLIVASPHTILYGDYFHIAPGSGATGTMAAFGAPQVRLEVQYDAALRDEIVRRAEAAGLQAGYSYTYTVTVSNTKLEVSNAAISDWSTDWYFNGNGNATL